MKNDLAWLLAAVWVAGLIGFFRLTTPEQRELLLVLIWMALGAFALVPLVRLLS